MDQLLNPDTGLMFWTIVTFLAMLFLLKRFAWGPLLHAIEERERKMREERSAAEKARAEAQRIQGELEARFSAIDAKALETLARATREAEVLRGRHAAQAQEEAKRLLDKTRAELEEEKRRLVVELRKEVGALAVSVAEKVMRRSVDESVRKTALEQFLKELDASGSGN